MEKKENKILTEIEKLKYTKPDTKKHEPVKVIQGSGGCGYLYYVGLYYY